MKSPKGGSLSSICPNSSSASSVGSQACCETAGSSETRCASVALCGLPAGVSWLWGSVLSAIFSSSDKPAGSSECPTATESINTGTASLSSSRSSASARSAALSSLLGIPSCNAPSRRTTRAPPLGNSASSKASKSTSAGIFLSIAMRNWPRRACSATNRPRRIMPIMARPSRRMISSRKLMR